jgi:hypothetical protein
MGKTVLPIHGEDHCPGGPDPLPCLGPMPWVRRRFTDTVGSLSCPDANDVVVTYNDGGDEGSAEVQGSDDWQEYWSFPNAFQTQHINEGFYLNSAKLRWDNGSGVETWICMDDGPQFPENLAYFKPLGALVGDNYCATWPHRQGAAITQMRIAQDSTGARVVASFYWEIWYLGPYTGPDPDDANTVDPVE